MKGILRKVSLLLLAIMLLMSLASCDLFSSGTKDPTIDEKKVTKPEFSVALENYKTLDAKYSEFDGKVVLTVYGKVNENTGTAKTFSAGQHILLKRIQNGDKIYIDGELGSCDLSDNMVALLTLVKQNIGSLIPPETKATVDTALGYLDGTRYAKFLLGYDNSTSSYNFKGRLTNKATQDEIFYATNNEYIQSELQKKSINTDIHLNDYLMFSTFVNFSNEGGWISGDAASNFFDAASAISNYQMSASNEKIYKYVLDLVENFVGSLDVTKYASDIAKYNDCIDIIKKWITIGESSVTASVNKDNLPVRMQTATRVNINIDMAQLSEVIYTICSNDATAKKIMDAVDLVRNLSTLRGTNNETNTIGISLDLSFDETFKYDEESVSLKNADADLFIDAKTERNDRVSYIVRKEEAAENSDGNNG